MEFLRTNRAKTNGVDETLGLTLSTYTCGRWSRLSSEKPLNEEQRWKTIRSLSLEHFLVTLGDEKFAAKLDQEFLDAIAAELRAQISDIRADL